MKEETIITEKPSDFQLMYTINKCRNKVWTLNEKIKEIEAEKLEVEEELKANEDLLKATLVANKPRYLKFEYDKVVAIYPNRIKIIELE